MWPVRAKHLSRKSKKMVPEWMGSKVTNALFNSSMVVFGSRLVTIIERASLSWVFSFRCCLGDLRRRLFSCFVLLISSSKSKELVFAIEFAHTQRIVILVHVAMDAATNDGHSGSDFPR